MAFRDLTKSLSTPTARFGLVSLLAITLPAVILGPWLPLHDLVAFVGMDAFPAKESFGPYHYEVLQFTYILHLVASRFMSALGIMAPVQIVVFYLVQAWALFFIVWRLAERLIPGAWLASMSIAFGALAFWEGQCLWGGPLPCSLSATLLAVALALTLAETEGDVRGADWLVPLLAIGSLFSHPFGLPFALVLTGFRFVFVARRRWQCGGLAGALLLVGIVISRDSPDPDNAGGTLLTALSSIELGQIGGRLRSLFTVDVIVVRYLFRDVPVLLHAYLIALGVIHLVGFLVSPVVAWLAKDSPQLRALATLNVGVALMYFLSPGLEEILPFWPQRILAFYSPFTFIAGIAGSVYLVRRQWAAHAGLQSPVPRVMWLLPVCMVGLIVGVQVPIFGLSREIQRNYEQVRGEILQTGISDAFVVQVDLNNVQPFYLRCVPFLLFSDRQMLDRHLQFFTSWHIQARHPTRLAERLSDLGRKQYVASFGTTDGLLHVRLVLLPRGESAVPTNNNSVDVSQMALLERQIADKLTRAEQYRDACAHYRASLRLDSNNAETLNNFGVALALDGKTVDAIEQFERAVRLRPDYVDAQTNLGYKLIDAGRTDEAAVHFQAALRVNPNYAPARDGLRKLEGLK